MRNILFLAVAAIILSSCSYTSKINLTDTALNFEILELNGNSALVMTSPDDDYTLYYMNNMEAAEYDRMTKSMSEAEFQKYCMTAAKSNYDFWRKTWPGRTDKYVANEYDHEYYVSSLQGYLVGLKPQTEYCLYGFCINPGKSEPLGPIQKTTFTTVEYKPTDNVDFDFMINDTKEELLYYVRPSHYGKICYDTYFTTVFRDSAYLRKPYGGDIRAYLKAWLDLLGDDVQDFLSIDISRFQATIPLNENENYTILACPYDDLGNGPLTLLHFTYKEGMKTSYGHSRVLK